MSLIGIVPKRTRMEWTRNEDGTLTLTHKEWFNEEDYKTTKEATKFAAQSLLRKFGVEAEFSMDDQNSCIELNYKNIPANALVAIITGELCPQCLKTPGEYLRLISLIVMISPVGPVVGKAATSIQDVVKEIGEKVYKLTPEEQKQLSTPLVKVLKPEE